MKDSELLQAEADAFKKTMDKCGQTWDPAQIALAANYDSLLSEDKDFCMQRAGGRWDGYHQALVTAGEAEFADRYFPIGASGGPGVSRLREIGNYLKKQEERPAQEASGGTWWDRTKSAVRNIFDLEDSSER